MKKVIFTALMGIVALGASAQNIQFHYDFGRHIYSTDESARQAITLTYEGFHADGIGSWYYFIDADFDKNGMMGAYTEISREFTFAKPASSNSFAAHIEYDGGLSISGGQFQQAALFGPAWNWHSADFSKTVSVQVMYKQFFGQSYDDPSKNVKPYSSFQITGVWGLNFCNNKLTFSGFIDFWRGIKASNGKGNLVILTEPQLWYNVSKHVSFGTEIEMSNNFIYRNCSPWYNDKFYINPTLAFKYSF